MNISLDEQLNKRALFQLLEAFRMKALKDCVYALFALKVFQCHFGINVNIGNW